MGRPTIIERARLYVGAMPAAISGQGGCHNATFAAACALVKGFDLLPDQARPLMDEYNARCVPQWSDKEITHKLRQAHTTSDAQPRGYLLGDRPGELGDVESKPRRVIAPAPRPVYEPETLRRFSGHWAKEVDLVWLANRSALDPAEVDSDLFLQTLYKPGEQVLMFNQCNFKGQQVTQGEALWPSQAPLRTGKYGVWFLPQPVDGLYHPNPRSEGNKASRRSEESVLNFRWLLLESDTAPVREWLGALVQLPLRIAAIYSSGGRSVHALVEVNAATKSEWDKIKVSLNATISFLLKNGLDKGVLSAVRLSRLPDAWREGKVREHDDGRWEYIKLQPPQLQKLLYIDPTPPARPICDRWPKRDVVQHWLQQSEQGISDGDETGGAWLRRPLWYYSPVSKDLRRARERVETQCREAMA